VLGLLGVVYCQQPTLIYVTGCVLQALWALESTTDVVLALNRCLEIAAPRIGHFIFEGLVEAMLSIYL
jgi:hypothetical protein